MNAVSVGGRLAGVKRFQREFGRWDKRHVRNAQAGKAISAADATLLLDAARRISAALGCQ